MKAHLKHLSSMAGMPDAFFQDLSRLCGVLGVSCPDGRSSPREYMKKCADAAERVRHSIQELSLSSPSGDEVEEGGA